ncbi:MAG: hypothetical protein ACREKL_14465, partial [Chthoniobacterales bacterium]
DTKDVVRTFVPDTDYKLTVDANGKTTVTFTDTGAAKLTSTNPETAIKTGSSITAKYVTLNGNVTVEPGAVLSSPTSAAHVGGRVALVGANVKNGGTISTPDGQTILAGGLQVAMIPHASDDPSLRGLDVIVGEVGNHAGRAVNDGLIDAPRANVTITGRSVQQNGYVHSTTSVSLNGRIDLIANYDAIGNTAYDPSSTTRGPEFLYKSTGVVTLGDGSVTEIIPELSSAETVAATELSDAQRSQVHVQGLATHFDKGSLLWAPNAKVDVNMGNWHTVPGASATITPTYEFANSAGQIYVDSDAAIDVAGTTAVSVPLTNNILTLQLRGSELADSPLQRDGSLRAVSITIDARQTGMFNGREWIGTPLGDASGFLGLIQRNVGELTTKGGSVDFRAGGSVVLQRGSVIDVSGGWLKNQGGLVKTTKVLQGSRLLDIADATPDQLYDGIYDPKFTQTHSKWGVTKTYRHPLDLNGAHYERGYQQGTDAGSISITAPSMALDGRLSGNTVVGPKQLRKTATSSDPPARGKLSLVFQSQDPTVYSPETLYPKISPTPPKIVFGYGTLAQAGAFALDADGTPLAFQNDGQGAVIDPFKLRNVRKKNVILSPELLGRDGFGSLTVDNSNGDIVIPSSVTIAAPARGSLTLSAANISVQGDVSAPNGTLSFTAYNVSPYLIDQTNAQLAPDAGGATIPLPSPDMGRFVLGRNASLSTAGLTVDDRGVSMNAGTKPIFTDGGSISIAAYDVKLKTGGDVDVSGGVNLRTNSD